MKISPNVRTCLIISAVLALVGFFWWAAEDYLNPEVKAAIDIRGARITIKNLNRISWENPVFVMDDDAELHVEGSWAPGEQRTFLLSDFRNPTTGWPHNTQAKKGFRMMVSMSGFTTTFLYSGYLQ